MTAVGTSGSGEGYKGGAGRRLRDLSSDIRIHWVAFDGHHGDGLLRIGQTRKNQIVELRRGSRGLPFCPRRQVARGGAQTCRHEQGRNGNGWAQHLQAAAYYQHQQNDQDQTQPAAGIVSPASAIRPSWERADQKKNQDD